ncbi:MAG: ABC transporter substrate-binding protein [Alphaproteobacteria bacterium]|nr:ABC transporter substrate-binding protein [Alphaproteobacteria bacterium]
MHRREFAGLLAGILAVAALTSAASAQTVQGVTKDEILIGMHTDLSGVAASYGVSSSNAIRMRIEEVNQAGGIHGRKLRLIVEDAGYQVPRAVQAGNKLIKRDRVFLMVGNLGTPMNNAVLGEQIAANIPNMFPITAAKQMTEPFHQLKFGGLGASYYDHIRSGVKWMVEQKGKKRVCAMYQDTDFGKEVFQGIQDQLKAMNMTLVESVGHKPTDQDFTAQITRLRAANCDLIGAGVIIRDAIIPYATMRKMGWTNVDFLASVAAFDQIVASAQGNATEGMYVMGLTEMPYRDTARPEVAAWWDKYRQKYNQDPAIGAVYGYIGMDLVVIGLDRAGRDLTVDKFIKAMESIDGYRDIFGGPVQSFGPRKRIGSDAAFVAQVRGGRFVRASENIIY